MNPVPVLLSGRDAAHDAARGTVLTDLKIFNREATGAPQDGGPLSAVLRDGEDGPVLGGLIGYLYGSWLHLDLFHLPEPLRRMGHGTRLITMLEDAARARGAVGSYVDTFSFQARGFYEGLGYTVYGVIEGLPPGHRRYALLKRFADASPGAAPGGAAPDTAAPDTAAPDTPAA